MRRCGRCQGMETVCGLRVAAASSRQLDNLCRICTAAYKQEHYVANRRRYIDSAQARTRIVASERAGFLIEFFPTHPCVDCGEDDALVLEFDHLRDKAFDIARGLRDRSWGDLLAGGGQVRGHLCKTVTVAGRPFAGGFVRAAVAQRQSLALPRR